MTGEGLWAIIFDARELWRPAEARFESLPKDIYFNSHHQLRILCNFDCPLVSSLSALLLFAFLDICEYSRTPSSLNRSLSASIFSIGIRNLDMSYVFLCSTFITVILNKLWNISKAYKGLEDLNPLEEQNCRRTSYLFKASFLNQMSSASRMGPNVNKLLYHFPEST